ncbi:PhlD [Streptomyces sp. NPDC088354]|uniref:PhlD n=1 Tax=Streptomyces sp. NPDC088354 TaxID=3365856 RepID=UPI00382BF4AE
MTAYVTRPSIVLPPHKVTTSEIVDDIRAHHADHARLAVILRAVAGCGVETRYFTRPLAEVTQQSGVHERVGRAFDDAVEMAAQAAQHALDAVGMAGGDVDCLITSHTTSWAVPNLDVHLIGALGLRPTVARIPMATLACAGGVQALVRAAQYLKAQPGGCVLVAVSEVLSAIYHRTDTTIESMIYRALFGDSAGAVVVTDEPLGAGLAVDDGVEIVLPDSLDRYWGRLDYEGLHFDSTKKAARAAADTLPLLQEWMGGWRPSWAVIHPGGPRIINDMAAGLGIAPQGAQQSVASLREVGNLGGVAALDVLARTHTDPPVAGSAGMAVAVGPGFTLSGVRGHWHG